MNPVMNVGDVVCEPDESDPPGYRGLMGRIGAALGAERLGASIYELPAGQSICPYHYEFPHEEWLLVLEGQATVRVPAGIELLDPGDVVCFPEGPDGAHKVTNDGVDTVRVLFLSTVGDPSISVYPDSGKVGVWPPGKLFRESDAVDYWSGETRVADGSSQQSPGR
jgi:uncharacterized cupin superfamily protein